MSDSHNIQVGTTYKHPHGPLRIDSMETRYNSYSGDIRTTFRVRWAGSPTLNAIAGNLDKEELLNLILECKTEE